MTTLEVVAKKTGQLNVRIDPWLQDALEEIEENHRIGQSEMVRGLVEAAVHFYKQHGWFGFPVTIEPKEEVLRALEKLSESKPKNGKK